MTTFSRFQGYTARGTQSLIERGQVRECAPGQILYNEGDPAPVVLLVIAGEVEQFLASIGGDARTDPPAGQIRAKIAALRVSG